MLKRRDWLLAFLLVLVIGGTVLADTAYVASTKARVTDKKGGLRVKTVVELTFNQSVEVLEGEVGSGEWCRVRTSDGKEGWIIGNALRETASEVNTSALQPNDPNVRAEAGAAARGWNPQVEKEAMAQDEDYRRGIERLEGLVQLLTKNLKTKKAPTYYEHIDAFYLASDLNSTTPDLAIPKID